LSEQDKIHQLAYQNGYSAVSEKVYVYQTIHRHCIIWYKLWHKKPLLRCVSSFEIP